MSLPDHLIVDYFTLVTRVPAEEVEEISRQLQERSVNPMELKKRLAREIVGQYHGPEAAGRAEAEFERVFQRREAPEEGGIVVSWDELPRVREIGRITFGMSEQEIQEMQELGNRVVPVDLVALLAGRFGMSMSAAGRLIQQGAVSIDGETKIQRVGLVTPGSVIRVGKHRFLRIVE
jgi:tyrosyl-tRNA synthetase